MHSGGHHRSSSITRRSHFIHCLHWAVEHTETQNKRQTDRQTGRLLGYQTFTAVLHKQDNAQFHFYKAVFVVKCSRHAVTESKLGRCTPLHIQASSIRQPDLRLRALKLHANYRILLLTWATVAGGCCAPCRRGEVGLHLTQCRLGLGRGL